MTSALLLVEAFSPYEVSRLADENPCSENDEDDEDEEGDLMTLRI
jgi:hypothetical protein